MNRNMSEIGSAKLPANRQREVAHRYILGLYKVLEEITTRFPDVLFESCSGGGEGLTQECYTTCHKLGLVTTQML